MGVIDFHILGQAILYFCALLAGFVIAIPIGVVRIDNKGACMLYADFDKFNDTHFKMTGSSPSNCNFPIYFSVFALIFYGLGTGLYNFYAVYRSSTDKDIGSQMWVMPFILINSVQAVAVMIVACVLSVGFHQFCSAITKNDQFKSCAAAESSPWMHLKSEELYYPGPFFRMMTVAQVAAWSCVLVWILQVALSILRFIRNRRMRSAQMFDNAQQSGKTADTSKFAEVEPTA